MCSHITIITKTHRFLSCHEIQPQFSTTILWRIPIPHSIQVTQTLYTQDNDFKSNKHTRIQRQKEKGMPYQAKELPSSTMSSSQKTHQTRFFDSSCGRKTLGFLTKNLTSAIFDRNRSRNAERESLWRGKYLWRGPWS